MDDFDSFHLFKTVHVLGVVMLAGAIAIEGVAGPLMKRASSVQELPRYGWRFFGFRPQNE